MNTEKLKEISKDKSIEAVKLLLETLSEKHSISKNELLSALVSEQGDDLPVSIFSNHKLSSLEIIVKYLKENRAKKYSQIAKILNRDDRTIWSTYNASMKKQKGPLLVKKGRFIPVSFFSKRKKSVLETLVIYLKDNLGYEFSEIARLLKKNYQTIYTSYRRGKLK